MLSNVQYIQFKACLIPNTIYQHDKQYNLEILDSVKQFQTYFKFSQLHYTSPTEYVLFSLSNNGMGGTKALKFYKKKYASIVQKDKHNSTTSE